LANIGIVAGDTLFVHSSLRAFGHVEGGADAVIEALLRAVGPEGTGVMPTFTWDRFHDKTGVTVDMARTPSEVGRITELFRQRPAAVRSPHICHSVAAIGRDAEAVTRDSPSVFDSGGPFDTLLQLNAWNLFLGVTISSCTVLHMAEERIRVPYRFFRDFKDCHVIHPDGTVAASASIEYLREPGYFNDFSQMEVAFTRAGLVRQARIGAARVMNIRMRDVVARAMRQLEENINSLLSEGSLRVEGTSVCAGNTGPGCRNSLELT